MRVEDPKKTQRTIRVINKSRYGENSGKLHERVKHVSLKGLAKMSQESGHLVSKEDAIQSKWFEEHYLDNEVWTDSWDEIVYSMKSLHPEVAHLKPKAKIMPSIKKAGPGENDGKDI